jgi:hypothetical protein
MSDESKKSELADEELQQATGGVNDRPRDPSPTNGPGQPPSTVSGQQAGSFVSKGPVDPDQVKP